MKENDIDLIQRTLDGDESAFTALVNKYQKWIHTLVWRKIGDFHIAEEITQDIFLKVYRKLSTLKPPENFPGWLYVLAYLHKGIAWVFPNVTLYHVTIYTPVVCFCIGLGALCLFFYYTFGILFSSIVGVLLATLPGAINRC